MKIKARVKGSAGAAAAEPTSDNAAPRIDSPGAEAALRGRTDDDVDDLLTQAAEALEADRSEEAQVAAERALQLDPRNALAWYALGVARHGLGAREAGVAALQEACLLRSDDVGFQAMLALLESQAEVGWQDGFRKLVRLQRENPHERSIREQLARAYMAHATRELTQVEPDGSGGVFVTRGRKTVHIPEGAGLPTGSFPTTALAVKNAAYCLQQVRALGGSDPEVAAALPKFSAALAAARARHYRSTWGETGLAAIYAVGGFASFKASPGLGLFMLTFGLSMFAAGFEPQYRTNRTALSRRGVTIGEMAASAAQQYQWGGLAYLVGLILLLPFVAGFKLYKNWGEEWLARPDIEAVAEAGADDVRLPGNTAAGLGTAGAQAEAHVEPEATPLARMAAPTVAPEAPEPHPSPAPSAFQATLTSPRPYAPRRKIPVVPLAFGGGAVAVLAAGLLGYWTMIAKPTAPSAPTMTAAPAGTGPNAPPLISGSSAESNSAAPQTLSGPPVVRTTAELVVDGRTLELSGIVGQPGPLVRDMRRFIIQQGGAVSCQQVSDGDYLCRTASGYDVAAAALINGAARAKDNAPQTYRDLQSQAQAQQKGIWQ
jgi:hypothetical protein